MKVGNASGSGPYHIQAEINMIPLIDVALVLLIIFMVISPILVKSQLKVNLPEVTQADTGEEQTAIKVEVNSKGIYSVQGKRVPKAALKTALLAELPPGHQSSVLIRADKDASFQDVVFAMDLAKQFKVKKLGVAVLPKQGQP